MADNDLRKLVTVAAFATDVEASLARGALEAAGIDAYVPAEGAGTFSRYIARPVKIELQVKAHDLPMAVAELKRLGQGANLK